MLVSFWSLSCTNQVCISQHILDLGNVLFGHFQYLLFYFSAFLKILSLTTIYFFKQFFLMWQCYSCSLWIIYVRSVNYTSIFDMSEILDNVYIWVFLVKSKSVLLLAFAKYMFYSNVLKTVFLVLSESKNTCFATKNCSKYSYICAFALSKKPHNWLEKSFHKSGIVGRRKLSDHWLAFVLKGDTAIQQSCKIELKKQLITQIIKKLNSAGRGGYLENQDCCQK